MWCGAGISLTGLGCWPQGRGMLPGLHIVIIASNEPAHEAQCLWVFPLSLCYNIHDSSHYGAFWAPWGTGRGNLSMLLPASVKAQSMQENPWVCMYSVWERTYLCSTVCDWSLAGTDFSVFSLLYEKGSCWRQTFSAETYISKHSMRNWDRVTYFPVFLSPFFYLIVSSSSLFKILFLRILRRQKNSMILPTDLSTNEIMYFWWHTYTFQQFLLGMVIHTTVLMINFCFY